MIRSENYILRNRLAENFSIWHQKSVDSTYDLPNDLFLVKQLYMGTYVFEKCKILEISRWFVNEIMILEMIYRNRTKNMFGRNLLKPYNFIINTKRQNSINYQ